MSGRKVIRGEDRLMSKCGRHARERGFALITAGISSVAILGMLGLAVDLGRLYIIRNEMQAYADSASLAAALELDGTSAGIARAQAAVAANTNRWNLGASSFRGTQVDFATAPAGSWEANPSPAAKYTYARVRATGTAPLYFLPIVSSSTSATVTAKAVAGQVPKPNFREGVLPFSPFAHDNASPNFGFTPGQRYTLRWPANPILNQNVCPGDNEQVWIDKAKAGSSSDRGYIEENSAAVIRAAIESDYQTRPIGIGDTVEMTGGAKQTERDALIARINQDSDPVSTTYAQYKAGDLGNGRRIVAIAVNNGYPEFRVLGFAAFFLLAPSEGGSGGNEPFCAEYIGPYVQGGRTAGAGGPGAYVVRLVQ
jgi:Flp pilus assembly protein TadG